MLARALAICLIFATPGITPALAWAQPAGDPCSSGDLSHHDHEGPHADTDEEPCEDDCRAACACPCCPVRVSFGAPHLSPSATTGVPGAIAQPPATRPLAGVPGEIFHPPSP